MKTEFFSHGDSESELPPVVEELVESTETAHELIDVSGKPKALLRLRPGASWSYINGVLDWQDTEQTEPTEAEIDAEVIRLQAEYDNQQYQRDRQYPSLEEQADMAYWDRKNGTTTLDDALDAVKAEYPKPTE
jgi:hypothetical protein